MASSDRVMENIAVLNFGIRTGKHTMHDKDCDKAITVLPQSPAKGKVKNLFATNLSLGLFRPAPYPNLKKKKY